MRPWSWIVVAAANDGSAVAAEVGPRGAKGAAVVGLRVRLLRREQHLERREKYHKFTFAFRQLNSGCTQKRQLGLLTNPSIHRDKAFTSNQAYTSCQIPIGEPGDSTNIST